RRLPPEEEPVGHSYHVPHRRPRPAPLDRYCAGMPDLTAGRVIAKRYEILALIGRGGAASVWRAYDPALQREVAVKELMMAPHMALEERRRAMREARTAARVQHPGA